MLHLDGVEAHLDRPDSENKLIAWNWAALDRRLVVLDAGLCHLYRIDFPYILICQFSATFLIFGGKVMLGSWFKVQ